MRYVHVGQSGLVVSAIGVGGNNFGGRLDRETTMSVVNAALELGVTCFDTSDNYGDFGGSESLLGEFLAAHRSEVVIATKFGADMRGAYGDDHGARGSRWYIRRAIEGSLRRLRTDYIDLYQMHAPDPTTPLEETIEALFELRHEGKVRYLGHSNFAGWQIAEAHYLARASERVTFVSSQSEYSVMERFAEREILPACTRLGLGFFPYFPLANGLLTGKFQRGQEAPEGSRLHGYESYATEDRLKRVEALSKWASEHGRTLLEVAFGWLASQPAVTCVIAGASSAEQVRANIAAGNWVPSAEEVNQIGEASPLPRVGVRLSDLRRQSP